jgi:hypothetical protein
VQIQAVSDLGNLLFFVFLLTTAILTAVVAYRKARRRRARSLAVAILVCLCAYAVVLVGVSLISETRQLTLGTDKCFDDWCATVISARSLPETKGLVGTKLVAITLGISNRARRAAFHPSQPRVTLVLGLGDTVTPSDAAQREFEKQAGPQESLAKRLVAGDKFQTTLIFTVPAATREASVVLLEGPALITRVLVGDENSFFHRKMVYPITVE